MNTSKSSLLLPKGLRPLGFLFFILGIILLALRFYFNIKPDWLVLKMFAIYSSYLESKKFTILPNQLLEEISFLFILSGLLMVGFSTKKWENNITAACRYRALLLAVYFMMAECLVAVLFFYGIAFLMVLMAMPVLFLANFIIAFEWLLYNNDNQ